MSRLPKILAIFALIFLLGALIIQQTVKQNREEVTIIESSRDKNTDFFSVGEGFKPSPSPASGGTMGGLQTRPYDENILGEQIDVIGQISINDAIFEELDAVPGVGPKTAEKIINGRPWTNLDDVLNLISKQWREEARGMLKL